MNSFRNYKINRKTKTAALINEKKYFSKRIRNYGFTLIEFLLYLSIFIIVLVLTGGFLWNIVFGNIKASAYQEVQQNGSFVLTKITQEVKKALTINNPVPGDSSDFLSLAMASSDSDPTVFELVGGKLRISKGFPPEYHYLTSEQVVVTDLRFINLSYEDTPGTVRIEITFEYLNPGNRIEYQARAEFKTTVSLFPGGAAP